MIIIILSVVIAAYATSNAVKTHRNQIRLVRSGIKTTGFVIGTELVSSNSGIVSEYPIIKFTATPETDIQVRGAQIPFLLKGEKVTLFYEAGNPKNFAQETDELTLTNYLTPILAWLFVGGAIIFYVASARPQ